MGDRYLSKAILELRHTLATKEGGCKLHKSPDEMRFESERAAAAATFQC